MATGTSDPLILTGPPGYTGCPQSNGSVAAYNHIQILRLCYLEWSKDRNDLTPQGLNASTLDACAEQCVIWQGTQSCVGVVYHVEEAVVSNASCYLKSSAFGPGDPLVGDMDVASAYLES